MKKIKIASYGKINLSLDVGALRDDGYHEVDMIMSQVLLHDLVTVEVSDDAWVESEAEMDISISCNFSFVPTDERNICYKATTLFFQMKGKHHSAKRSEFPAKVHIDLQKKVPVGAGLGGGSGNGAAVLHGLNALMGTHFSLEDLCEMGSQLGADVPFAVMNQAKSCRSLPRYLRRDPLATIAVRARGIGTDLEAISVPAMTVLLVKPGFSISTKKVYQGIDHCDIPARPNNDVLVRLLDDIGENGLDFDSKTWLRAKAEMVNVLENYTIKHRRIVEDVKRALQKFPQVEFALMSGSGPTVFAILKNCSRQQAYTIKKAMVRYGNEAKITEILDGKVTSFARNKNNKME